MKSGKKQRCPLSSLLLNISIRNLVMAINQEREENKKKSKLEKKETKLSLFADVMMIYIEDAEKSTKKLLETIN